METVAIELLYRFVRFPFIVALCAIPYTGMAVVQEDRHLRSVLQKAANLNLASDQQWLTLLFYQHSFLGGSKSLIDSPYFFLSKKGKTNPELELKATIRAFYKASQTEQPIEAEDHRCRYPARFLYLRTKLPTLNSKAACPQFMSWFSMAKAKKVSLVFSSFFVNNPASMMGHTFLRLHRFSDGRNAILDKIVNFAAIPTTENPLLYTVMGLSGGFRGVFSLMPYYQKIQEYGNHESRDLWEYQLDLTETEIKMMIFSLWEVAPQWIDYYYFDENCSAILLFLLDVARPSLQLRQDQGFFVNPSDTIRRIMASNIVVSTHYRPSNRQRFVSRFTILSRREKQGFYKLKQTKNFDLEDFELESRRRILDAGIAQIAYKEKLAGAKSPTRDRDFYRGLLMARAKISRSSVLIEKIDPRARPHLGHQGGRLGLGLHSTSETSDVTGILDLRPALHDFKSVGVGYSDDLSIELGRISILLRNSVDLNEYKVLHILSVTQTPEVFPVAWGLELGGNRGPFCLKTNRRCFDHHLQAGLGLGLGSQKNRLRGWFIPATRLGYFSGSRQQAYLALGAHSGISWEVRNLIKVALTIDGFSQHLSRPVVYGSQGSLRFRQSRDFEWFANVEGIEGDVSVSIGAHRYL